MHLPAKSQVKMDKGKGVEWKWRQCGLRSQDLGYHPDSAPCKQICDAIAHRAKCRLPGAAYHALHDQLLPTSSPLCSPPLYAATPLPWHTTAHPLLHTDTLGSNNSQRLGLFQTSPAVSGSGAFTHPASSALVSLYPSTAQTIFEH